MKNFRSHEAILAYPNAQFYGGELEVCGSPTVINSFLRSPVLVNQRWPVVFHYVSGENERESTSPSYFNIDEATEVLEYIKKLLRDRQHPIRKSLSFVIINSFLSNWSRCGGYWDNRALLCSSSQD